ncbi:MAG TPA: hypothetical protein VL371_14415 [Gemmataceae bacterium]|nr:hypothetical protein [Gemmataceae bacterium]
MFRTLALLTIGSTAIGFAAAQDGKVGTQPGETLPGPFRALVVTGPTPPASPEGLLPEERQNLGDPGRVQKFHDFVTRYGLDPVVAVFSHDPPPAADQPLAKLFKELDQAVEKYRTGRLHAFGVFLTLRGEFHRDETLSSQIKQIEAFGQQAGLKNVPLALDQVESERTKAYGIAPADAVTVLIYSNQVVRARFSFSADKPLDDAGVQAILAEVTKLVAPKR